MFFSASNAHVAHMTRKALDDAAANGGGSRTATRRERPSGMIRVLDVPNTGGIQMEPAGGGEAGCVNCGENGGNGGGGGAAPAPSGGGTVWYATPQPVAVKDDGLPSVMSAGIGGIDNKWIMLAVVGVVVGLALRGT